MHVHVGIYDNMFRIVCIFLAVWTAVESTTLPRTSVKPTNADPSLDCAIKELAWEFAKKLLPQQGSFQSAYDALQLEACNISLSSGKHYKPPPFHHRPVVSPNSVEIYVATNGNDDNPGTIDKPLQTLQEAVKLFRFNREVNQPGIIYLRGGTYYLDKTINLGPSDRNLMISGYGEEKVVISGGKVYKFDGIWKEIVNEMGPTQPDISAISGTIDHPGDSNDISAFYGKVNSYKVCRHACEKNSSCFAFTWYDSSMGSFANMCYFRIDGLWVRTPVSGTYSGKKLKIFMADLEDQNPNTFTTLFINGRRAVRARYPDGNPETMGLHTDPTGYVSSAQGWLPPEKKPNATEIHIQSPERNGTHFPQFQIGIGGPVAAFDPPESYWGTKNPNGGRTYEVPTGLEYSIDEGFTNRTWKRPSTGVVHAFHCAHWGNWQFAVSSRNDTSRNITWSYGGFQEARGCDRGSEWYVENILEELDAPNEWYYDDQNQSLYLYPNGSAPMSGIGTVLDRLINIQGSMDDPVYNITITNLTFAHTATTFLKSYEVPSGGDWSVHRGGALYVEGVDGFLLQNCLFDSPGGNGVFLSNYIRNAVIEGNEFVYSGDSAIVAIGSTVLIDGTIGNQPRGTKIIGNLMHEFGVFGKQVMAYGQALACETTVMGNVMFNGPRAGINFNDGFGGGNLVAWNLAFNLVRETSDNGCFNSWDRQPYLTEVRNGTPSLIQAQSNMTRNFFISNYHSIWPIDHDDGSCYYYDTYNYLIYGGYKNYLGHTQIVQYNVYVYPDVSQDKSPYPFCAFSAGASTTNLPSGWGEVWGNNSCIIGNPVIYTFDECNPYGYDTGLIPFTANNTFYVPHKEIYILCSDVIFTLDEFQLLGYDIGSTALYLVDTDTIIDWGRTLLGL